MTTDIALNPPIAETEHYAIFDQNGTRTLQWKNDPASYLTTIDIARPEKLSQQSYSPHMLMPLVLIDNPRDVILIGLGGGQQVRFIREHFPQLHLTALEIDPVLVDLARQHFGLPPDDACLRVVVGDGAAFVAGCDGQCDLLLSDASGDGNVIVDALHTEAFYRDCHRILRRGGIMTVNVYHPGPTWGVGLIGMLRGIFDQVYFTTISDGEQYVITLCKDPLGPDWDAIAARAGILQPEIDLPLIDFVNRFPRSGRQPD